MGLKNEGLLQQLLTKDHKKPLEELFQLALTFEAEEKNCLNKPTSVQPAAAPEWQLPETETPSRSRDVTCRGGNYPTNHKYKPDMNNSNVTLLCASCGGSHLHNTCKFCITIVGNKAIIICKVCRSTAGVVQFTIQSPDSAVVPLSNPQQEDHIPPMFQSL